MSAEPLKQDVVEKAAQMLLAKVPTAADDVPKFVLNGSLKNRLRVHRPRCEGFALCGWPWAEMVSCGVGVVLKPDESKYYKACGTCLRRALERGLAVA